MEPAQENNFVNIARNKMQSQATGDEPFYRKEVARLKEEINSLIGRNREQERKIERLHSQLADKESELSIRERNAALREKELEEREQKLEETLNQMRGFQTSYSEELKKAKGELRQIHLHSQEDLQKRLVAEERAKEAELRALEAEKRAEEAEKHVQEGIDQMRKMEELVKKLMLRLDTLENPLKSGQQRTLESSRKMEARGVGRDNAAKTERRVFNTAVATQEADAIAPDENEKGQLEPLGYIPPVTPNHYCRGMASPIWPDKYSKVIKLQLEKLEKRINDLENRTPRANSWKKELVVDTSSLERSFEERKNVIYFP